MADFGFNNNIIPTKSFMDQTICRKSCTVSNVKTYPNYYQSFSFPTSY